MDTPVDTIDGSVSEGLSSSDREILGDLGECRLLARLGVGGMGQVYKAMHRRLERLVAVKMLPAYLATTRGPWRGSIEKSKPRAG